jgi:hypothetical protein
VFHFLLGVGVTAWIPMGYHAMLVAMAPPLSGNTAMALLVPYLNTKMAERESAANIGALQASAAEALTVAEEDPRAQASQLNRAMALRDWSLTLRPRDPRVSTDAGGPAADITLSGMDGLDEELATGLAPASAATPAAAAAPVAADIPPAALAAPTGDAAAAPPAEAAAAGETETPEVEGEEED